MVVYDYRKPRMIGFALVDLEYMAGVSSHEKIFKKEIWYGEFKMTFFMISDSNYT